MRLIDTAGDTAGSGEAGVVADAAGAVDVFRGERLLTPVGDAGRNGGFAMAMTHEEGMRLALAEARRAFDEDEVPVGAVVVRGNAVIASAHNRSVAWADGTAHAELLAMQAAARQLGGRLTDCTLYVTLEPCAMCAGAAVNLRLGELVFGAFDARAGCCGSVFDLTDHCFLHSVKTWGGVLEREAAKLLSDFFDAKRCNL